MEVAAEFDRSQGRPNWASYLYQSFLLPSFSPNLASQWLSSPFAGDLASATTSDYFSQSWQLDGSLSEEKTSRSNSLPASNAPPPMFAFMPSHLAAMQVANGSHAQQQQHHQQPFISTSYLNPANASGSGTNGQSIAAGHPLTISPSTLTPDLTTSPTTTNGTLTLPPSQAATPEPIHMSFSASQQSSSGASPLRRTKRTKRSIDSLDFTFEDSDAEADHDHEHDHEGVPEGVEKDGMIWGMRVEDYRALSARERKRVRNRISARTFRAKRKEHLSSLETTLNAKDTLIKKANEESAKLRKEVADLKRRLGKYETV